MEMWKNKKIGIEKVTGNIAMIDTEGIEEGGGIYQIAIIIVNENCEYITSKSWYIKEKITSNIEMHKQAQHNKEAGVYKKLLKIANQKNAQATTEQVKKSVKQFLLKYQVKNIFGHGLFFHDLPLIRKTFDISHIQEWLEINLNFYDTRPHFQHIVDYNGKYSNYTVKKKRYSINELSKYFINRKEKHTAINDCKVQIELLNMLKIA